ncbi:MAG: ABC transporter permease, partial [Planctomycetes bacterium]|nr:ABC transporter permease [Planctomycetota bacterium]
LRVQFGLDKPLFQQYITWLWGLVRGDWGKSFQTRSPVLPLLAERFLKTLLLTVAGLLISLAIGVPLGILAATRTHTLVDYLSTATAVFGISMPMFWLAIVLQLIFALSLDWFPLSGSGKGLLTLDNLWHLVLPAFSLGLPYAAQYLRFARSTMLEILGLDYIKVARSKGLSERRVLYVHALRNALIPIVTLLGLRLPWMIGGAVVIETIFAWPGMGSLVVRAMFNRDFHVVEGFMVFLAALVVLSNLGVDVLYGVINPTVKYD